MGVRSSSTENRQWMITRRRCLNGTVPVQAPTPDVKLAGVALFMLGIILECGLTFQASATLVPCTRYANFVLQAKNAANKTTDRCFEAGCHGA